LTPGLPWALFNATDFARPDRDTGIAPQINLDTGTRINDYSQFWSGYLKAPVSGEITIMAEADDGLRLALKGMLVINPHNNAPGNWARSCYSFQVRTPVTRASPSLRRAMRSRASA
jgi:hypothetical protein